MSYNTNKLILELDNKRYALQELCVKLKTILSENNISIPEELVKDYIKLTTNEE